MPDDATDDLTGARTWQDPSWRAAALAWAREHLGTETRGEPEQRHVTPWSTAIRVPVGSGAVWLKAVGSGSAHEPALSEALGGWAPDRVLVPLAVDPTRRLVLLPDGGTTMRETGAASSPGAWADLLRHYARLQQQVAPHAAGLLARGVPDVRPSRLPDLVAGLLADDEALLAGRPGGLDPGVRARIAADLGRYAELCRALAAGGVPATLQHDDLHDGNVLVDAGRLRFFDWGDASVSHPFLSLLVALRTAAHALGVDAGDPVLFGLRDAYLDEWRGHGTRAELEEQVALALRVGPLQRALTWWRVLSGVVPDERARWHDSVAGWAAEHLEPGILGPADA